MAPSGTDECGLHSVGNSPCSVELSNGDPSNPVFVLREKRKFYTKHVLCPTRSSGNCVTFAGYATGQCGSDVSGRMHQHSVSRSLPFQQVDVRSQAHYRIHGEVGDFKIRQPLVLGHESAGIVQRYGSAVRSLKPGDRVALEPGIPCRSCEYCQAGKYNLCPQMHFAATAPYDGTLANYYTMLESLCYRLPAYIILEKGALVEPLILAVHCATLARIKFGSSVLVLDAGPTGLLCCAIARALVFPMLL